MRPLEILLTLINLLALLSLVFPRLRAWRTAQVLPVAALLISGVQVLMEGARWQMVPAYAVSVALLLAFLAQGAKRTSARGLLQRIACYAGATLGMPVWAFSFLLPFAIPVFALLQPTGPHAVGTLTYHWVDSDRAEIFTAHPNDRRELMVQIWYPVQPESLQEPTPYLADGTVLSPVARLLNLPGFVFTHLNLVSTHAVPSAPVADGTHSFPVLVFSHGRGGIRQHNTFQVEALVSHGYVVAAIDHPYAAAGVDFPDGRRAHFDARMLDRQFLSSVIPYLAQDVSFTLDKLADMNRADPHDVLTGRLDLQRIGIFGVSLGGAVAAEACLRDTRLRACLPMDNFMPDAVVQLGLTQPTMWISRDVETMRREGWAETDITELQTTMRSTFRLQRNSGYLVLIPGMYHQNFSDFPYYVRSPLDRWLGLDGPINARRGHAIINAYSLAFFDFYLNGVTAKPMLDGPDALFPEVILERNTFAFTVGHSPLPH